MTAIAVSRLGLDDIGEDVDVTEEVFADRTARRAITSADAVLIAFCAISLAVALVSWGRDEARLGGAVAIGLLLVANLVLDVVPVRWHKPMPVEITRAAMGAVLAPAAYLTTVKPFGHWWPGFMLMCITSVVTVGVLTGSARYGRIIVTYYIALFSVSAVIAEDVTVARGIVVGGGIAIAGLLVVECVAGLGQKLAVERTQRAQIEELMLRVFPESVVAELGLDHTIAHEFDEASILFADIEGFTTMASAMEPSEVVSLLNEVFSSFDTLVDEYGLEKIKTIGDCYMVAAGVPDPRPDHAVALCAFGLRMQQMLLDRQFCGRTLRFRVGINSGPVVAGIVGKKRFLYDLWGDAVNVASRMESNGEVGMVQVTEQTYERVGDVFTCVPKGLADIKGKGMLPIWHVVGPK